MRIQFGLAFVLIAAASSGCGNPDKPYEKKPDYKGKAAAVPEPPNLPQLNRKDGDNWTIAGLTHDIRSEVHHADVNEKKLTAVGYIVKTNLVPCKDPTTMDGGKENCVPECAVPGSKSHPEKNAQGLASGDPEGCKAPVPTFWIADKAGDAAGETIQVMGWATNFTNIHDAIVAWDKEGKDKHEDKKWQGENLTDKSSNILIPFPLPAVGAKVKVSGFYADTASTASGLIADPLHGIIKYESMEYVEPAPELANLPTMKPRKKEDKK
jgi:hypothetical protein